MIPPSPRVCLHDTECSWCTSTLWAIRFQLEQGTTAHEVLQDLSTWVSSSESKTKLEFSCDKLWNKAWIWGPVAGKRQRCGCRQYPQAPRGSWCRIIVKFPNTCGSRCQRCSSGHFHTALQPPARSRPSSGCPGAFRTRCPGMGAPGPVGLRKPRLGAAKWNCCWGWGPTSGKPSQE